MSGDQRQHIEIKELKKFGLIISIALFVVFGVIYTSLIENTYSKWLLIFTITPWLWSLTWPETLRVPYRIWIEVGNGLAWVNNRIILGIIFFIILFPVGLLLRLLGKDALERNFQKEKNSYRLICQKRNKNQLEKPY